MADNAKPLLGLGWTLLLGSGAVVGLRMYARLTRVRRVAVDDYLMLASWSSEVFHMIFVTVACTKGLGHHFAALTPTQQQHALFYTIGLVEVFAVITCMWGRLSFAAFLLYIIGPSDVQKRWALRSVIAVQILVNLIVIIQIYTQCGRHVTALWDYAAAAHATCLSPMVETIIGYVQSGVNSMCDITLTVLPAMILWNLNMPLTQKIGLGATLTLSIFAFAASLAKAVQIRNLGAKDDFTWYMVSLQTWVCIENNVVMGGEVDGRPREEYILQSVSAPVNQITKTMDVHVAYEARSEAAERDEKEDASSYRVS
ncbi:hypothetical protein LTR36_010942 [Oleoguttula mirabilis]|uniref:Rhodopsin domain-containing protein n=1 Tax=Oleoguttula mirabilis TaxID=1507867 RepID=A0AAV9J3F2_9PEZI|nr:hypothetical protein LTR36_010942 [Oleoguttula mirabilis]